VQEKRLTTIGVILAIFVTSAMDFVKHLDDGENVNIFSRFRHGKFVIFLTIGDVTPKYLRELINQQQENETW
jgi:hypothetical protein